MSRIILFGSSGFIGRKLLKALENENVKTIKSSSVYNLTSQELSAELDNYDTIINVAGVSIFSLWTTKYKRKMYQSRINFTNKIREAVSLCSNPPSRFISASAVGIYESFKPVTEYSHEFGDNFLAHTVLEWENASLRLQSPSTTVTIMRFGIVFGRGGGAYRILRFLCRFNLGGYFGKGDQPVSFIWIDDLVRAIIFIIDKNLTGVVNVAAPTVTNFREIGKTINAKFKSRLLWPVPEFILKSIIGETSVMYLEGQIVNSKVLTKNNFNFEASDIKQCIDKIEAS